MEFTLTKESMEMLIEEIIDAVKNTDIEEEQVIAVKTVLENNGIVEIKED